jgi:S1-C subfamily serine protease
MLLFKHTLAELKPFLKHKQMPLAQVAHQKQTPANEQTVVFDDASAPASAHVLALPMVPAIIPDSMYSNIVRIVAHTTDFDFELPFKINGTATFSGTGFFINSNGDILTCAHVVSNASHVYIEIPSEGKQQYAATVLGVCPFFDLAVIHIEMYKNSTCCELEEPNPADINAVQSGDETYALGFPLGQDNLKVTKGIISGQQMRMYQIDTPINPGNSGGPLLKNGRVIGVNGAGMLFANNIGYAVPIARYFMLKEEMHRHTSFIFRKSSVSSSSARARSSCRTLATARRRMSTRSPCRACA